MCCGQSNNKSTIQKKQTVPAVSAKPAIQIKYGVTQIVAQSRSIQQQQRERNFQRQIMATKKPIIAR